MKVAGTKIIAKPNKPINAARTFVHKLAPRNSIIIIKKTARTAYKIDFTRGLKPPIFGGGAVLPRCCAL